MLSLPAADTCPWRPGDYHHSRKEAWVPVKVPSLTCDKMRISVNTFFPILGAMSLMF